jgi:hypothetical protein
MPRRLGLTSRPFRPIKAPIFAGLLLLIVPVAPADAQDVQHFLMRVDRLLARGPFALFSPDFYRLKALVEADGDELKREYAREKAAGRPTVFCPPAKGKPRVSKDEYVRALRAVPVDKRPTTDTRDVLRSVLERKYPCPTGRPVAYIAPIATVAAANMPAAANANVTSAQVLRIALARPSR